MYIVKILQLYCPDYPFGIETCKKPQSWWSYLMIYPWQLSDAAHLPCHYPQNPCACGPVPLNWKILQQSNLLQDSLDFYCQLELLVASKWPHCREYQYKCSRFYRRCICSDHSGQKFQMCEPIGWCSGFGPDRIYTMLCKEHEEETESGLGNGFVQLTMFLPSHL